MLRLLLLFLVMTMSACTNAILVPFYGAQYAVHIQSDTYWRGKIGNKYVDGWGDRSYVIDIGQSNCYRISKTQSTGLLRVYFYPSVYAPGTVPGLADQATTLPFATLSACIDR